VLARIKALNPKILVDVTLKSLYQLTYQTMDRTLTDEDVSKVHDKLHEKLVADGAIALR